jgi:hypothetical protein
MTNGWLEREAVVVVKAYPNPSVRYFESVCCAAITREEGLIRLFPISYRALADEQRFKKYQRITLRMKKHEKDDRPESYRPDEHSIRLLDVIEPTDNWRERWEVVEPTVGWSTCEIIRQQGTIRTSLGCIRPLKVSRLLIDDADPDWSESKQAVMQQITLFDSIPTKLEKIPFVFRYEYHCSDADCNGHCQSIIDWELMELYRKLRDQGLSRKDLRAKIEEKFLGECCAPDRDTHFFIGNHSHYRASFMVLGVFWPRKDMQKKLF